MRTPLTRLVLIFVVAVAASPALAQTRPSGTADGTIGGPATAALSPYTVPSPAQPPAAAVPGTEPTRVIRKGYFSVNAGYQGATNSFTARWSYPSSLETATVTAEYPVKPGVLIDIAGGVRLVRDLTVGVAVSRYQRSDPASLSASVPHPFFYNQPRTLDATVSGPQRTETAVHVQAMWTFAAAAKVQVGLFGGPSVFSVRQVIVSAVNFAEAYPYDTITLSSTSTQTQTASKVGFNVGADVAYLLNKQIGVGVMIRYSGVTVGFKAPDGTALSLKAGGLQVGAGFRVRFWLESRVRTSERPKVRMSAFGLRTSGPSDFGRSYSPFPARGCAFLYTASNCAAFTCV
jgi:opacity protein-like surface antigen